MSPKPTAAHARRQVASRTSGRSGATLSSRPCHVGSDSCSPPRSPPSSPRAARAATNGRDDDGADTGTATVAAASSGKITLLAGARTRVPGCDPCRSSTARTACRPASTSAPPGTRPVPRGVRRGARGQAACRNGPAARAAPGRPAVASPDSPGWATVGTSDRPELEVPLSDFVAGLDVDKATYSVTLRASSGRPRPGDVEHDHRHLGRVATGVRAGRTRRARA